MGVLCHAGINALGSKTLKASHWNFKSQTPWMHHPNSHMKFRSATHQFRVLEWKQEKWGYALVSHISGFSLFAFTQLLQS
jgi:hypothetical protein